MPDVLGSFIVTQTRLPLRPPVPTELRGPHRGLTASFPGPSGPSVDLKFHQHKFTHVWGPGRERTSSETSPTSKNVPSASRHALCLCLGLLWAG